MPAHYDSVELPKRPLTDLNGDPGSREGQGEKQPPRQAPKEESHHGRGRAPNSPLPTPRNS